MATRMKETLGTLFLFFVSVAACTAEAPSSLSHNPFGPWYLANANRGWYFDLQVGVESEPTYAGSDDNESELDGNLRALYRSDAGHRYFLSLGEFGALMRLSDRTVLGMVFEYEEARTAEEDPIFEFFEDVDATVEGQLSLFHRWGGTYGSVVLQPDILDRGKGFVWFIGVGKDWLVGNSWLLSTTFDISGADSEHMQTEFGVSEQAAQRAGLRPFTISGGIKSASAAMALHYLLSPRLSLVSQLEVESYLGDTKDSPLIKDEGSAQTYEVGVAVHFQF